MGRLKDERIFNALVDVLDDNIFDIIGLVYEEIGKYDEGLYIIERTPHSKEDFERREEVYCTRCRKAYPSEQFVYEEWSSPGTNVLGHGASSGERFKCPEGHVVFSISRMV